MKFILLVFLIVFNTSLFWGQSPLSKNDIGEVDELIKMGDSLKDADKTKALSIFKKGLAIALDNAFDEETAVIYKKIGVLHHRDKNYKKAENNYKKGLLFDSISNTAADLNYNLSLIKAKYNQQDSLLFYLVKSLKLYESFKFDKAAHKAFLKASIIYKDRQFYDEALKYAIMAYEGFKTDENKQKLADACTSIGNIQNQIGNYNQALAYHFQALDMVRKVGGDFGKGICYTNIANVYDNLKVKDSAIANYKTALGYFEGQSTQYAVLLNNLAMAYKDIGDFKLAEKYFKTSINVNQSLKDTISLLYNYNGITSMYLEDNNLKQAGLYLDYANTLVPSVTDNRTKLGVFENKAEYYKKTKQYNIALGYQTKYINLYTDIYNSEQAKLVQDLQVKFDFQQKENKILALNLANKNAQLLLSDKNKSIYYRNLTLIILGIIILLVVLGYQYILQKQKTATQTAKIEKLEAIYKGQETIKKRIARDLHDIITTNFDGLRLKILALKRSTKLNDMVDGITEELKRMNQQIRTVSHRLYPLEMYIGKQQFTDIIKSRLSEFQLYGKVFVELKNQLPEVLNQLPLSAKNNFYGILLEVLNNVEKHALATKVSIDNQQDDNGNLHFIFEDNGIGIKRNHKEGIGLMNIKQRVELLEGNCTIKKTNTGTQVHINFPIVKANESN